MNAPCLICHQTSGSTKNVRAMVAMALTSTPPSITGNENTRCQNFSSAGVSDAPLCSRSGKHELGLTARSGAVGSIPVSSGKGVRNPDPLILPSQLDDDIRFHDPFKPLDLLPGFQ
jgi:hypothetical protein